MKPLTIATKTIANDLKDARELMRLLIESKKQGDLRTASTIANELSALLVDLADDLDTAAHHLNQ